MKRTSVILALLIVIVCTSLALAANGGFADAFSGASPSSVLAAGSESMASTFEGATSGSVPLSVDLQTQYAGGTPSLSISTVVSMTLVLEVVTLALLVWDSRQQARF